MRESIAKSPARRWFLVAVLAALSSAGCSSKGTGGTGPNPTIALTLNPTSASVAQGGSTPVTATLTRGGGFGGDVVLTVEGVPTGVTGAVSNISTSGSTTTATVTISVAGTVAAGTYSLTLRGTASGVTDATAPFSLTVTAVVAPSYALSLSAPQLTIVQGANAPTTVNIARTNFTAGVTLSLEGGPTGVSGAFGTNPATGATSVLTVTVGAAVAPATYNLTVRGVATGLADVTTGLSLIVSAAGPAPSYTLAVGPAAVQQGGTTSGTVTIARTNFTGNITLVAQNVPAGLTVTPNPTSTTGNTSSLTIAATAGLAANVYTITIRGTSTLADVTTTFGVTVSVPSGGSGNVTLDFRPCLSPLWVAYQDGNGPWVQASGSAGVFHANITSGKGGYAYVYTPTQMIVAYATQAELIAGGPHLCGATTSGINVANGTVAGVGTGDRISVAMGGGSGFPFADGAFSVTGITAGVQDLFAFRNGSATSGNPNRLIIRRGLNIPNAGSLGTTLDFNGGEAVAPATATITVAGMGAGDEINNNVTYYGGTACYPNNLYSINRSTTNTFTASGVPSGMQQPNEVHMIGVTDVVGSTASYSMLEFVTSLSSHTMTLGGPLPVPTVTPLTGPYTRLQGSYVLPAAYNTNASFFYTETGGSNHIMSMTASFAWLGGTSVTLATPDFSAVAGWNNAWAVPSGATGFWFILATGSTSNGINLCTSGTVTKTAQRSGPY